MMEDEVVMKLCARHNGFLGLSTLLLIGMSTPNRFEAATTRSDALRKRRILREVVLISVHNANDTMIIKDPSIEREQITPTRLLFTAVFAHTAIFVRVVCSEIFVMLIHANASSNLAKKRDKI